jgi:hypothetical protein
MNDYYFIQYNDDGVNWYTHASYIETIEEAEK